MTDTIDYAGKKQAADVPADLWVCHTATIDGYIVEGPRPTTRPGTPGTTRTRCCSI